MININDIMNNGSDRNTFISVAKTLKKQINQKTYNVDMLPGNFNNYFSENYLTNLMIHQKSRGTEGSMQQNSTTNRDLPGRKYEHNNSRDMYGRHRSQNQSQSEDYYKQLY